MQMKQHVLPDPLMGLRHLLPHVFAAALLGFLAVSIALFVSAFFVVRRRYPRLVLSISRLLGMGDESLIGARVDLQVVLDVLAEMPFFILPVLLVLQYKKQRLVWRYLTVRLMNNTSLSPDGELFTSDNFDENTMKERFAAALPRVVARSKSLSPLISYPELLQEVRETLNLKFNFHGDEETEGPSATQTGYLRLLMDLRTTISFELDRDDSTMVDEVRAELEDPSDDIKLATRARLAHVTNNISMLKAVERCLRFPRNAKSDGDGYGEFLTLLVNECISENEIEQRMLVGGLRRTGEALEYEMGMLDNQE